jgi:Sec-independent protein translocase protein TatA
MQASRRGFLTLLFGPRQLPRLGKAIGETIRELRGVGKELRVEDEDEDAN